MPFMRKYYIINIKIKNLWTYNVSISLGDCDEIPGIGYYINYCF